MCCVSAANLDGEGSDEDSQSVSDGDHDPPSPEPVSPNSSSLPVGPDGMLLFSYCSCIEYNPNHRHLD